MCHPQSVPGSVQAHSLRGIEGEPWTRVLFNPAPHSLFARGFMPVWPPQVLLPAYDKAPWQLAWGDQVPVTPE